jgi:hypothetical protein
MNLSDLRLRRRFLGNAITTAGVGLTSAMLFATRSRPVLAAETPGKMADTKGMKVGVVVETLSSGSKCDRVALLVARSATCVRYATCCGFLDNLACSDFLLCADSIIDSRAG